MSWIEDEFKELWENDGPTGFDLVFQHRFCDRLWKFDAAIVDFRIAIELEGLNGRHQRTAGFLADMEKYTTAASMGWLLLRFSGKDIKSRPDWVIETIETTIEVRLGHIIDNLRAP